MTDDTGWTGEITDSGFFGTEGGDGAEALDAAVIELVDELVANAPEGREGLIRVLLGLQQTFRRVSWRVQELVADRFGLSPAQVAGVVSFYPRLSAQRRGSMTIDICTGSGCFLRGGGPLLNEAARIAVAKNPGDEEDVFDVRQERCLGICGLAPVVRTDGKVRASVGEDEVGGLMESLVEPGQRGENNR